MDGLISQIFEAAAKVGNEWSLFAFAVAALTVIAALALKKKSLSRNANRMIAGVIVAVVLVVIVAALPPVARAYLESHGIYRLRVTVEDPSGMTTNDAKVTSSIGGEPKKVEGGWEFDIPTGSKPKDGKLTVYAEMKSAFLKGKQDVELTNDYNLTAKVRLDRDRTAHIRGRVVDRAGNPIADVQVSVVGYESEAVLTGPLGQFDLPAHAADGQQVQIAAFKKGIGSVSEWKQAGDQPETVVLDRKR